MVTLRSDGRDQDEVRELSISYEGLNRVDGSARFGFGATKALASVSGPIEVRLAAEQASRATFEVTVRPIAGLTGTEAKSLSSTIRAALTPSLLLSQNPRALIQLVIQSVTPTISHRLPYTLIASLINASTLALLNAGSVPMRGVVCAVAVGRLQYISANDPNAIALVLDPSDDELSSVRGGGCFAFLFAADLKDQQKKADSGSRMQCEVVWSHWQATAAFDDKELGRARELANAGAEQVWCKMKESVGWMNAPSQEGT